MTEDQQQARDVAMRLLSRREYSSQEIASKLKQRGFGHEDIEFIQAWLQQQGFQSDDRFAEHYTRFRAGKGYGPQRISVELREKGLTDEAIEYGLSQAEVNWFALVQQVHDKKFKAKPVQDWQEKARQSRFLMYRGFAREHIETCLGVDDD